MLSKNEYLREPFDELSDVFSELSLGSSVIHSTRLVKLEFPVEPEYNEVIFKHFLVIHELHECASKLNHLRVLLNEVLDD